MLANLKYMLVTRTKHTFKQCLQYRMYHVIKQDV